MRLASAAALLACLSSCASASSIATGEAQAGQQPREDRAAAAGSSLPPGLGFLRALGGECRSCLKECLGTQATALQQASLRWQAPISLVTWYLFRNRPFKMWPLEEVVYNALKVHPAVWGSLAAGGYVSCSSQCDAECPFPGQRYDPSGPAMRELEEIDAADTSWLMRLYRQGGSRGGGSRGGIQDTLGTLFQL